MFNNLTYVQQCLREESIAKLIREQNPQFFSTTQKDIDNYLKKYLQSLEKIGFKSLMIIFSWQRVATVLQESSGLDRSVKTRYAVNSFQKRLFSFLNFRISTRNLTI